MAALVAGGRRWPERDFAWASRQGRLVTGFQVQERSPQGGSIPTNCSDMPQNTGCYRPRRARWLQYGTKCPYDLCSQRWEAVSTERELKSTHALSHDKPSVYSFLSPCISDSKRDRMIEMDFAKFGLVCRSGKKALCRRLRDARSRCRRSASRQCLSWAVTRAISFVDKLFLILPAILYQVEISSHHCLQPSEHTVLDAPT